MTQIRQILKIKKKNKKNSQIFMVGSQEYRKIPFFSNFHI